LPAVQVCLIPARRDAPRRVVKIIRHSLPAVPLFQQLILAAVRIFPSCILRATVWKKRDLRPDAAWR
ncbi:hypothetical protein DUA68_24670, partial [Salmonella enterica subsp. enterica serovar Senftenberg]|nr:hypothetical protein [Salmonella enterica subsp. enterica serovar Senftenberg]EAN3156556.1 hypothetical protein [Salmonella enterica]EBF1864632.1 hypothetical protein [Salmonella enterica subsp. enterica serovar Heidelberg]EAA7626730.1 hypothetical protein [Salmonella enterica subsp. enterica serovar Senftenberg]EAB8316844.1 hypothetical protein [Salmonella enterica subsp. enterica serovar Senftenberg]